MEAATDPPPLDLFLYFPLPLPEFDLEYTTDFDLERNFQSIIQNIWEKPSND